MKTLNTHNSEMEKKFDEDFMEYADENENTLIDSDTDGNVVKNFITNQNKQLYIKIAEGELKRLKKNLETELAIDRFAHPDYHKGYEMAFHENTFYWNNILQELNK